MAVWRSLLADLGLSGEADVRIRGADPVLATRFRIGEAAAAALAAGGVAAARIHQLRGGAEQAVGVDVQLAAASLISFALGRLDGEQALRRPALDNPTVALYETRDGRFIHLHGGFPHLERGILELLDCERSRDALARRVRERGAFELEQDLADAGLCGAVVRGQDEWRRHEQGRRVDAEPLVAVERVCDAPARALPDADRPLCGVRVLDLTRVLAGPTVGRTLAAHGADVLKITAPHLPFIEPFVIDTGHGKRSAHLDVRERAGVERLLALVRDADVCVDGYRPGALAAHGLSAETLMAANPALVHVQLSCYGHTGPWSGRRGWEQLAQSVSGIADEQGGGGPPALLPAAACDYTTGYLAAAGTLAGLLRRATEGGGFRVRASLSRTAHWLQSLGRVDGEPCGIDPDALGHACTVSRTEWGALTHLGPVLEMEATPPRWTHPVVPLGTHAPNW